MKTSLFSLINRRNFLKLSGFTISTLILADSFYPNIASANSQSQDSSEEFVEKYQIFVPYKLARYGGEQIITLKSGERITINIPAKLSNNYSIVKEGVEIDNNKIKINLHTLYDQQISLSGKIFEELNKTTFKVQATKQSLKDIYRKLEDGENISNLADLELLDYVISSSKLSENIRQRYIIASQNFKFTTIEQEIEKTLANSQLTETQKQELRGTFQYIKALEPIPNFLYQKQLDTIVISNSNLPQELKTSYQLASATVKAVTVDILISQLIKESKQLNPSINENYLAVYLKIRDGKQLSKDDQIIASQLTSFITNSNLTETAKVVFLLAKDRFFEDQTSAKEKYGDIKKIGTTVKTLAQNIIPVSNGILTTLGASSGTGVALSSLSGGASLNATLALLGGGSVATGGLGMLGGLAVITGGAALIGAAGLLSIALIANMDQRDYLNLGIAGSSGIVTGTGALFVVWTGASLLAGELTGAAAISATIAALGGVSVITGGVALVSFGVGVAVLAFLNQQKSRNQNILDRLESRTYILADSLNVKSLIDKIISYFTHIKQEDKYVFVAPDIPLDKGTEAIVKYAYPNLEKDEKIIALIDGSSLTNKLGIIFTDRKIIWKDFWQNNLPFAQTQEARYSDLKDEQIVHLSQSITNATDRINLINFLQQIKS